MAGTVKGAVLLCGTLCDFSGVTSQNAVGGAGWDHLDATGNVDPPGANRYFNQHKSANRNSP
jgi:hypothetical protein